MCCVQVGVMKYRHTKAINKTGIYPSVCLSLDRFFNTFLACPLLFSAAISFPCFHSALFYYFFAAGGNILNAGKYTSWSSQHICICENSCHVTDWLAACNHGKQPEDCFKNSGCVEESLHYYKLLCYQPLYWVHLASLDFFLPSKLPLLFMAQI